MTTSRSFTNPTDCPVVHTMSLIGGKWKPIILHSLKEGKLRFGKLTALIPSISHKILAEQLRALEATGLIQTKQFAKALPRTEYTLTEKGKSYCPSSQPCVIGVKQNSGRLLLFKTRLYQEKKQQTRLTLFLELSN